MKKFLTILTAGCMLLNLLTVSVFGATATGKIINDKAYVPLRGVFEELGFTVDYDSNTGIATITNNTYTIKVPKDKDFFEVNGRTFKPDYPQAIVDGSMYLPLRAIGDTIGANINWDNDTKTAIVTNSFGKLVEIRCSDNITVSNNNANKNYDTEDEETDSSQPNEETIKMKKGETIIKDIGDGYIQMLPEYDSKIRAEKINNTQYKITAFKPVDAVIFVWSKERRLVNILNIEVEPQISLLNTQLPKEIIGYNWFGEVKNKCLIKNIRYTIKENKNDTMDVYFYLDGTKTYDKNGNDKNDMCIINWKLYDDDNTVIDSGSIYTNRLIVGDFFKDELIVCKNLPYDGSYFLQLYDDK